MHTIQNFKTKVALKAAVKLADVPVEVNPYFGSEPGNECIEMPHEFHKSYASVSTEMVNGTLVIPQGSRVR